MKRKYAILLCAGRRMVWLGLALLPLLLSAQKGKLKDEPPKQPTVDGGKGAIKAITSHDTLIGGDGFIPRTVIDSFPNQSIDSVEALRPGTRVRRDDLDASKARIQAMQQRMKQVDSVLVLHRQDTSGTWTPARLATIDSLLADSKAQIALAEVELAQLEARWEAMKAPAPSAESTPPTETPSPQPDPKPSDTPKPKPEAQPGSSPAPAPAPTPQPGTPAVPSGKGKVKGK
jgi:hypothetical protein